MRGIVEIVGVFVLVVSLVFVGMQLYFDRQVAIADQYAQRSESMKSDSRSRMESEHYVLMLAKSWDGGYRRGMFGEVYEDLYENLGFTSVDIMVHKLGKQQEMYQFDNVYFQYKQGLLAPEAWLVFRNNLKNTLRSRLARHEYEITYSYYPSLAEIIPEIFEELDNEE
jgi:hypothetical protein